MAQAQGSLSSAVYAVEGVPPLAGGNSHHGSDVRKNGSRKDPLSTSIDSSVAVHTGASVFPNTDANGQAQVLHGAKEPASALPDIPPMAEAERRDLSELAGRELNEVQARRFWKSLVITGSLYHVSEGRP